MSGRPWRLLLSATLLIVFLVLVTGALAQSAYTVTLTSPDTSTFPHLTAYLDVHDPAGEFVHGLTPQEVTLQENGVQVPVNGLLEKKPGVQFVIAIAPGSAFTIRDASGTSRYEYLLQGLLAGSWAGQSSGGDDLSLLTVGGPQLSHSSIPASLRSALESFLPSDPNATPNLEVLASALQVASDPTPRPGMERAILFITPPQSTDVSLGLQSILANANQEDIHIIVWLVASQESFELPEIDLLRNLASQTRATFFAFSHDEPVPDLETLLEPMRYVYQLGYDSQVATAGVQQVAAQVNIGSEQISSQPEMFELNLQPPALIILDPPTKIVREFAIQPTPGATNVISDMRPVEQRLSIQVTFPDSYLRDITRTSLYVDGVVAVENTSPPFEQLVWDLRPYTQDGSHTVKVEAVDSLGLVGQTGEISVEITVPSTTQEVVAVVSQKRSLVIGITVLVSASILVLVLIIGGRIRPKPYPGQAKLATGPTEITRPAGYRARLRQLRDPVTQPVKIGSTLPPKTRAGLKGLRERLPWSKHKGKPVPVIAYLMPLVGSDEPTLPAPLQITDDIVSLGSDGQKASLVIADPSIEGLHARINREGKTFLITDGGSVAGTWVNYVQIPPDGTILEHADIIHLGRIGFRFNLSDPGPLRKVTITPMEPDQ